MGMIIDWEKVKVMTSEEIENIKVEIDKEIQLLEEDKYIIKERYNEISKALIDLEGKRKDLRIQLDKASHLIRQKSHDEKMLDVYFWKARRGY